LPEQAAFDNPELVRVGFDAELEIRDPGHREIVARIVPWDVMAETKNGPEVWHRGSLAKVDPEKVVLRLEHENPPAGRGLWIEEREDGAYMGLRAAKTPRGDEILELARDRVTRGVSVGFWPSAKGSDISFDNGRRVIHHRTDADLREVSTTFLPTWSETNAPGRPAEILQVRGTNEMETVTPTPETPVQSTAIAPAAPDGLVELVGSMRDFMTRAESDRSAAMAQMAEKLEKLEERNRSEIVIPGKTDTATPRSFLGQWAEAALRIISGERPVLTRTLADIVSTDNPGVVPPDYRPELVGVINSQRPFLESTRRITPPAQGMAIILPKLVTRPTTDVQDNEKDDVQSTVTEIETLQSSMVTIAGGGDLSLQILRRSSPEFLTLYVELLGESYAANAEAEALGALLSDPDINDNGGSPPSLDPEDLELGVAWSNAFEAMFRAPDTIWLSSDAVAAFIDAKAAIAGGNFPLFGNLTANATAGGGISGSISGLRAVHVPALNSSGTDVIVGPSAGFAWAEDGTYTLQADNPSQAGRDVALVGMLWFAVLYPSAFTTFTV
jgi:phage head maturation protease